MGECLCFYRPRKHHVDIKCVTGIRKPRRRLAIACTKISVLYADFWKEGVKFYCSTSYLPARTPSVSGERSRKGGLKYPHYRKYQQVIDEEGPDIAL